MIERFMRDDVLQSVQKLAPIADELDLTMAQLAIAWVLQNDNVAAALVGASRPEQVTENVKASGVRIPAELMDRIDEALGDTVERDPGKTVANSPQTGPPERSASLSDGAVRSARSATRPAGTCPWDTARRTRSSCGTTGWGSRDRANQPRSAALSGSTSAGRRSSAGRRRRSRPAGRSAPRSWSGASR
jgi:hypothetical protein